MLKEYEAALIDFKKIVKEGVIKERGYNLATIIDIFPTPEINISVNNNINGNRSCIFYRR